MRLLLLSNSTCHGSGYLDHAAGAVVSFFEGIRRVLFVPFALYDQAWYWAKVRERFAAFGIEVDRAAEGRSGRAAAENAEAIFVGGGNTFRLLARLAGSGLLETIRERALDGMPYMGASAGTVISGPTIKTTNDMPIVQPPSFDSLGLVPFQINCHYIDADPASRHMGETRETRLREYLEENDVPVVGLREGAWLRVEGGSRKDRGRIDILLDGAAGAKIFRRGADPVEVPPGSPLGPHLLEK